MGHARRGACLPPLAMRERAGDRARAQLLTCPSDRTAMRIGGPPSRWMIERARSLRRAQTDAERLLWAHLRRSHFGPKFRRQRPIGPYVVDFYCHAARLVIELDGCQHLEATQAARDRERDQFLTQQGLRVLRFDDLQVLKALKRVLEEVERHVRACPLP